jgi:phosphoglycerol transferase MdoB-like AlkP superfamily enzyme
MRGALFSSHSLELIIIRIKGKKLMLNVPVCFALILVASLALTVIMLCLQATEAAKIAQCLRDSNYMIFILNFLPIFLIFTFLFFIGGHIVLSGGVTSVIVIGFSVINRLKTIYRFDPFVPWDFALGAEFMGIAKGFSPKLAIFILVGFLIMTAAIVAAFIFIKNSKLKAPLRICGAAVSLIVIALCNKTVMSDVKLNAGLPVIGNVYNRADQFNSKGFVYEFIYTFNTGKITKPSGYDKNAVLEQIDLWTPTNIAAAPKKLPHLFLILAEGFCEIPMNPIFAYGETDPMENYKKLKDESFSGYIVAPNIGGGTADTEFDILTGINTRSFRGVAYSYTLIAKAMNAMPRIMADAGYFTEAIHPGYPWFYNRQNVFPLLGFERFISSDDFKNAPTKGMYITESVTYDRIVENFENHLALGANKPYFGFTITIQNHGPYEGKYAYGQDFKFTSDVAFSDKSVNELANYFYGVSDMDAELGKFADYLRKNPEPAIIAYFGDHLPLLGDDVYNAAIESDAPTRLYETPYIVWANDAAKPLISDCFTDKMSAFYFGASLLECIGVPLDDPYFKFLNDLKLSVPVILESDYVTDGETLAKNEKNETGALVALYDQWAYYRIFDAVKQ